MILSEFFAADCTVSLRQGIGWLNACRDVDSIRTLAEEVAFDILERFGKIRTLDC